MNTAFPDARVDGYQALIKAAELPDPDDAHVLACAIKCKAQVIVTINLKDFPKDLLEVYDMEPQHPDVFLSNIFDLNPDVVFSALVNMVNRWDNPPMSIEDFVMCLESHNLYELAWRFGEKIS